jgi:glycosyltransferase involved in cell wall biosynthesis
MNILLLANEIRYTCGVTNHLLHLSAGLSKIPGNKIWLIYGGGGGAERFNRININLVYNSKFLHGERNLSSYTSAIIFLIKFIYKNKIDIIHSHSHYTANIARHASKFTGTKTIQTNHGLLEYSGRLKHFNADYYIAINEHIYEFLSNNKIAPKQRISFIRCGIPVPAPIPKKDISRMKVIAASRFTAEKGLDLYIKAISRLDTETRAKADFIIAGEGELKKDLMKMNKELGTNISFPGSVKNIYRLLEKSHILVFPSRTDTEGFPAIITEAGANGMLVISSDFKGVEDVIRHNFYGLIFKKDDVKDLQKKLAAALIDFGKFRIIAENFYSKVKDLYSFDKMISKHMELYKACLKK